MFSQDIIIQKEEKNGNKWNEENQMHELQFTLIKAYIYKT